MNRPIPNAYLAALRDLVYVCGGIAHVARAAEINRTVLTLVLAGKRELGARQWRNLFVALGIRDPAMKLLTRLFLRAAKHRRENSDPTFHARVPGPGRGPYPTRRTGARG